MKSIIVTIVACLGLAGSAAADTIYVAQDGSGDYTTIQAAVNAATSGDEIIVGPGTYTSTSDYVVEVDTTIPFTLRSSDGPEATIVDGETQRVPLRLAGNQWSDVVTIEGISFTRGRPVNVETWYHNVTLYNCWLTLGSNQSGGGGGLWARNKSSVEIRHCRLTDNTGNYSAAILTDYSDVLLDSSYVGRNINYGGSGGVVSAAVSPYTNNTFCENYPYAVVPWAGSEDQNGNQYFYACPNPGACCTGNDLVCVIAEEDDCLLFGHQWMGVGASCEDSGCVAPCLGDSDNSGAVDVNDILLVIARFGVTCP
ncbi:MAG: hypothetical protein MK116_07885 [Phycisphaerales bacterium]|nr:hypothetical protein [Phycisphaerales bacterium]